MISRLTRWFTVPEARGIDLDAPEAIGIHRDIIQNNHFLRRLYTDFYHFFAQEAKIVSALPGKVLELGSGGGFLKEILPDVLTSEVCETPGVDQVVDGERMPFDPGGLKAIFMLNVLHHIPHPRLFFREVDRCLTPGGRLVMIEPFNSVLGRVMYKNFHHEPFDEQALAWELTADGRMSGSNQAIPWIIFWRDRERFEQEFPTLKIVRRVPHTPMRYLFSGGVSHRAFVPSFTFPAFTALDQLLSRFPRLFPMFQTLVIEKR